MLVNNLIAHKYFAHVKAIRIRAFGLAIANLNRELSSSIEKVVYDLAKKFEIVQPKHMEENKVGLDGEMIKRIVMCYKMIDLIKKKK